jgi:hypothetical protein
VIEAHAKCVRLLGSLCSDAMNAASLFCRSINLGMNVNDDCVEKTCEFARQYSRHLTGEQSYRFLARVRDALIEGREQFKKQVFNHFFVKFFFLHKKKKIQYNSFSMLLMDLSDVGLDVASCQSVCAQLVRDKVRILFIRLFFFFFLILWR